MSTDFNSNMQGAVSGRELEEDELSDVRGVRIRGHLPYILQAFDDNGIRNLSVTINAAPIHQMPPSSNATSETSTGGQDGAHMSREQSRSTLPTSDEGAPGPPHQADSSVDATDGSRTVKNGDDEPYIWNGREQWMLLPPSPRKKDFARREHIGNAATDDTEHNHQTSRNNDEAQNPNVPTTTLTQQRILLLALLFLLALTPLYIAACTVLLARQGKTTLREAKLVLLLATHTVAALATFAAIVLRRPPTETMLLFLVIMIFGTGVRREVELLL